MKLLTREEILATANDPACELASSREEGKLAGEFVDLPAARVLAGLEASATSIQSLVASMALEPFAGFAASCELQDKSRLFADQPALESQWPDAGFELPDIAPISESIAEGVEPLLVELEDLKTQMRSMARKQTRQVEYGRARDKRADRVTAAMVWLAVIAALSGIVGCGIGLLALIRSN